MVDHLGSIRSLVTESRVRLRHRGIQSAASYATLKLYRYAHRKLRGPIFESSNIFEHDWDLMVVLDACRVDLMEEVVAEEDYNFVNTVHTRTSQSGQSSGWMHENFTEEYRREIQETIYVTSNPHTELVFGGSGSIQSSDFQLIDEVWKYAWDEKVGTVTADVITDRTINIARENNCDRLIAHYMQPHFPSVPCPQLRSALDLDEVGDSWGESIWDQLLRNKVTQSEIWDCYKENLKYVLDEVDTLLSNLDAETVVITSDHGNAMGEYGFFGHGGFPIREVRVVPWIVTTATDSGGYRPTLGPEPTDDSDIRNKLSALGYVD